MSGIKELRKLSLKTEWQVLNIWLRNLDNDDLENKWIFSKQRADMIRAFIWEALESNETTERKTKETTALFRWEDALIGASCDDPGIYQASTELRPFAQSASWAQDEVCTKRYLSTAAGFSHFCSFILSPLGASVSPPVTASPLLATLPLLPSLGIWCSFYQLKCCLFMWLQSCSSEFPANVSPLNKASSRSQQTTAFTWLYFHLLNVLIAKNQPTNQPRFTLMC